MKITKFVHSCLLVEMPAPVNRTALFDPGVMSESALDVSKLEYLDDIFITHVHGDHLSPNLIRQLVERFPDVRITSTQEVVDALAQEGIKASTDAPEGVEFFHADHENVVPLFPMPQNTGIHYLDTLTDPGDSHTFNETKEILALPITAPWGSSIKALNLALQLKPKHVLPIHDWHWNDDARQQIYDNYAKILAERGITFHKLKTGEPVVIEVADAILHA
jgi:L-ascorbate metabolism protein UlaG (beta-lactamase superfamily)